MNPFDFSGPDFLIFYVALCAVVIVGSVILRRKIESAPTPRIDLSDPLLIAFLRGGETETMRVAAVSLVDRGLLTCSGTRLKKAPHAQSESVRRPIEKELLKKFGSVQRLRTATLEQLAAVPGFGGKAAEELKKFLEARSREVITGNE